MRVSHLNMTDHDPSSQCPAGFRAETDNERFCIRNTGNAGCQPIIKAESFGLTYSHVCGYMFEDMLSAAQMDLHDSMLGLMCHSVVTMLMVSLSLVPPSPINHIWTYVAGLSEDLSFDPNNCPCNTNGVTNVIPEFVGNDYYCESSNLKNSADPLWDGMQCYKYA